MSRPHPKPGEKEHPTGPHQDSGQHNQCNWDGIARVAGEVEVKFKPDLIAQHKADQEENTSHNKKMRRMGWLTLIAVVLYTTIATFQWLSTRAAVRAANEANRLLEESTRARLSLNTKFQVMPVAGQQITIHVETMNVGKALANVGGSQSNWIGTDLPSGEMRVDEPILNNLVEPGSPFDLYTGSADPVPQEFLDGLPTINENLGDHRHRTQFFFGKIAYETLGHRYEINYCFYIVKADELSHLFGGPFKQDPFIVRKCDKWNFSD